MNETEKSIIKLDERIFTAVSAGFFFVLVGALFITTPNLFEKTINFVTDFELTTVPNSELTLPAPSSLSSHTVVYQAMMMFSFAIGFFQILILALRLYNQSPWGKRVDVIGNLVFWLGAGFLIQNFLLDNPQWFVFLSMLIIIGGVSLISRAIIIAASRI